jgi:hypothetical protein
LTVFSLDLHTNDLTRNGGLFVSSFLEPFLDRSESISPMASAPDRQRLYCRLCYYQLLNAQRDNSVAFDDKIEVQ